MTNIFNNSIYFGGFVVVILISGVFIANAYPIEVKDIQFIFPPQSTFLDSNGLYMTKIDKQVGEEDIQEKKAEKACVPKQEAEPSNHNGTDETTAFLTAENDGSDSDSEPKVDFNDETPVNGTVVEDPMEVKIYKPECDD